MKVVTRAYRLVSTFALLCSLTAMQVIAKDQQEENTLDISGYLMMDFDSFDAAFTESTNESDELAKIRRARLSFKQQLNKNWKTKLQLGFANNETEIKDAYLQYQGWQWADITIGKQKEAFGLEKLTRSRNSTMIERSIVTEAIAPGRSMGISAAGYLSSLHWQFGVYQPDESESSSAMTGRIAWVPWQQDNNILHLGMAFSERELNGSEYRINEQMEVYFSDSLIEGEKLLAEDVSLNGIELLWINDKFSLMAEWQKASITDTFNNNYDYQGGYMQMSYQLSGGQRKYKNGVLGTASKKGWELTSRYSQFELGEENEEASIYSIGVNYSLNKKVKFMADVIHAERFAEGIELDSGNAISLRAQYSF